MAIIETVPKGGWVICSEIPDVNGEDEAVEGEKNNSNDYYIELILYNRRDNIMRG
ncbi:MAG: type II toxin-antitoxin system HicB family antitoxin [Burkholderiales bacterium]|nr:type II toxin-antitoxin system HicB family antitoxin [Burkholderiales bacterium]MCP5246810.1 type II toxin-antitoxin system HicB family antitoxin [Burkholderiales bacterium]MDR4516692.1 hypothetical protein [Nitrosomonas sp.]